VTVTAAGAAIDGWVVSLTLPNGATVANTWNGMRTGTATSGTVTVANAAWNGRVGAGQSTAFGFQGTGNGAGATVTCQAS